MIYVEIKVDVGSLLVLVRRLLRLLVPLRVGKGFWGVRLWICGFGSRMPRMEAENSGWMTIRTARASQHETLQQMLSATDAQSRVWSSKTPESEGSQLERKEEGRTWNQAPCCLW